MHIGFPSIQWETEFSTYFIKSSFWRRGLLVGGQLLFLLLLLLLLLLPSAEDTSTIPHQHVFTIKFHYLFVRLGIISDVHSNLPALTAVLNELKDVDEIVHCGDLVGYNGFPNEVIETFQKHNIKTIIGNHDHATIVGPGKDRGKAMSEGILSVEWTIEVIKQNNLDYLKQLDTKMSLNIASNKIMLYHGSPEDPNKYIKEKMANKELFDNIDATILILGHTHVPFVKRVLHNNIEKIILNPGSVGQPRDGNWEASYAVLSLPSEGNEVDVNFFRIPYDINSTISKAEDVGLPECLSTRLRTGE
jgi:putative phosphoesterase